MAFKYSVILDTLAMTGNNVFEKPKEILEAIRSAGFDGVDIGANTAEQRKQLPDIVNTARSLGLKVPAFLGAWAVWHGGEERDLASEDNAVRTYAVNYAKGCIDIAAQIGANYFEICAAPAVNTYPLSKVPTDVLKKNFAQSAIELCAYARGRKVTVMIEPINRYEGHPGFMNSLKQAVDFVNELGIDNLAVLGDLFHMNIEDISFCDAFRAAGKRLKLVHLADHNRLMPGAGRIDFQAILRTLREIGFTGYMSLDCVPPKPDMKTFLRSALAHMKALEKANELQEMLGV